MGRVDWGRVQAGMYVCGKRRARRKDDRKETLTRRLCVFVLLLVVAVLWRGGRGGRGCWSDRDEPAISMALTQTIGRVVLMGGSEPVCPRLLARR